MTIERTLVFVKPDGVERGIVGEILTRFERVGLTIIGMKMVWADADHAKKHYSAHVEKPFYPPVEKYVTSGPVVAFVLEGPSVVKVVRKMVGSTEPHSAAPGTIRGDYAHLTYSYVDDGDNKDLSLRNIVHASGELDEAKEEIKLWFTPEELHSYELVHHKHTRG